MLVCPTVRMYKKKRKKNFTVNECDYVPPNFARLQLLILYHPALVFQCIPLAAQYLKQRVFLVQWV